MKIFLFDNKINNLIIKNFIQIKFYNLFLKFQKKKHKFKIEILSKMLQKRTSL